MKKIGFIALAILALSSCADDSGIDNALTSNLGIAFNTSTFAIGENSQTRAEHSEEPIILQDNNNNAALYLHLSVEENTLTKTSLDTRSTPVTGSNFQTIYKSFGVSAYTPEGTVFMDNVNVGNYNNPVWTPTDRVYFWPNDYALDFYAYAPYPAKTDLELNKEKGKVSFSYTTPKGTESNDAIAQPDLLFAYGNGSLEEHKNGTMPLKFSHALSAIKFVAKDINVGTTIQSISIKNVYGEGDCVAYPNAKTNPYVWTIPTTSAKESYTQTFDVTINETGRQEITDVNPEKTFMMIPQTLGNDAVIEVVVKPSDGEPITLTGSLTGQVWEAGKLYTYAISTESINWIYVFNVTETLTIEGFSTGKYNVKSYKYRAGREEEKVAVAWSAEVAGEGYEQYVTQFTYSGEGAASGDGTNYPIALMHTALTSSWPGDATLRENSPKGTENPYDLSTDGGTVSQTTANCYIVDAAGTYKLPLVYGNAIKDGKTNAAAYGDLSGTDKDKDFLNYKNVKITSPDITGADNCTLVWSDAFYMFKDVKISDDDKYLIFTIDPLFMQQANAVLAVRDSENKIMWSWHIWVTEHPINTSIELDDRDNENIKYGMMPYPLGWIDPKEITYEERKLTFNFTQDGGMTATMNVKQPGETLQYTDDGSVYYQWGRKDPLIGLKNRQILGGNDFRPHQTGAAKYSYQYVGGNSVELGTAIQNPNIFYSPNAAAQRSWHNSQPKHYLWDSSEGNSDAITSTKTIYDPSPKGYKVPPRRAFAIFVTTDKQGANKGTLNGTQNGYKYTVYPKQNQQGKEIILVATGQRADREKLSSEPGGLWAMYGVYYWSCYADYNGSEYYGYSLCIRNDEDEDGDAKDFYTSKFVGAQTMARPVRPIKE